MSWPPRGWSSTSSPEPGEPRPAELVARYPEAARLDLRVEAVRDPTPRMREVALAGPELAGLAPLPGQDLMVAVSVGRERAVYRRYTIRRFDPSGQLVIEVLRHGDGPGSRWVETIGPGDPVEAIGPRGKITLDRAASHHLFVGDDAALPMAFAMAEALPGGSHAELVLEVHGPEEERPLDLPEGVVGRARWVHRGDGPPGSPERLLEALGSLPIRPGRRHAYVAGELAVVNALREALVGRGLASASISAKAYWGLGRANAARGEPAKG